jgi:hypothetical protein
MSAKKKQPIDWVVLDGADVFCRRCGRREQVFPVRITKAGTDYAYETIDLFTKDHSKCVVTETSPSAMAGRSPYHWLQSGDTGTSSITICRVMSGEGDATRVGWPIDPSDFGRCYRLLKLFPQWRERLPEVAAVHPDTPWVAYVREWDLMTALWEEESPSGWAPKLYDLMKQLQGETRGAA